VNLVHWYVVLTSVLAIPFSFSFRRLSGMYLYCSRRRRAMQRRRRARSASACSSAVSKLLSWR